MESRIMQVFYGNDCLPYKDSARSVHYPIVGNSFIGASGTTQIRFYVRDIGGVNNVSWVAISKLPNGQIGNQVLSTIALDSELGEYYVALDLGSYYTQLKGDVYISLNGYQGGIEVEQDAGTGIYTITGTPIIEATGSIKLAINYAPQLPLGHHFQIDDLQQILGLMSEKANIVNTVQVVANITTEDLTGYDNGQLFYDLYEKQYYKKKATSPYYEVAEDGNGILGSKRALVRYQLDFSTTTLEQLFSLAQYNISLIKGGYFSDYIVKFDYITALNKRIRIVNLNTLETWTTTTDVLDLSNYISALINDTYKDEILHINNYKNYAVPYSGATKNIDINTRKISGQVSNGDNTKYGGFSISTDSHGSTIWEGLYEVTRWHTYDDYQSKARYKADRIEFIPNMNQQQYNYVLEFPSESGTFETKEHIVSNYVPYSGATKNLNLGNNSLITYGGMAIYNDIYIYQRTQGNTRKINFIGYSGSAGDGLPPGIIEFEYNAIKIHSYGHSYKLDKNGTYQEIATENYVLGKQETLQANIDASGHKLAISGGVETDFEYTITLKDDNNNDLSSITFDLPLESVVVSGEYDSANQEIILTLEDGSTIEIPVGDLVSGLVSQDDFNTLSNTVTSNYNNSVKYNDITISGGYVTQLEKNGVDYPIAQSVDVTTIPKVVQSTTDLPSENDGYLYLVLDNGYLYSWQNGAWTQAYQYTSDLLTITAVTVDED